MNFFTSGHYYGDEWGMWRLLSPLLLYRYWIIRVDDWSCFISVRIALDMQRFLLRLQGSLSLPLEVAAWLFLLLSLHGVRAKPFSHCFFCIRGGNEG